MTICLGFCAKVFCHLHFLFEIHSSLNPACKLAPQTFAPIIECFLKIDPSMFSQPIFLSRSNHFHIQKLTISIGSEYSKCLFSTDWPYRCVVHILSACFQQVLFSLQAPQSQNQVMYLTQSYIFLYCSLKVSLFAKTGFFRLSLGDWEFRPPPLILDIVLNKLFWRLSY